MINDMKPQIVSLKIIFETKKELKHLENFLTNNEIVTRKWTLRDVDENDENTSTNE
jgi:hypothetical protein